MIIYASLINNEHILCKKLWRFRSGMLVKSMSKDQLKMCTYVVVYYLIKLVYIPVCKQFCAFRSDHIHTQV